MKDSEKSNSNLIKSDKENKEEIITPEIVTNNQPSSLDVSPTKDRFIHSVQESHISEAALDEVQKLQKHMIKREVDNLKSQARFANFYKFLAIIAVGFILGFLFLLFFFFSK